MLESPNKIKSLIKEMCQPFINIGEVVTGSSNERKLIDLLKDFLNDIAEEVNVQRISVMSWQGIHGEVAIGGEVFEATPLPYTPSGDVDSRIIFVGNSIEERGLSKKDVEGKILLYESFDDVDEIESQYLEAVDYGALAFIVFDKYPSRKRKIVIKGDYEYRYEPSTPPPIPAVHLRREEGLKILDLISRGNNYCHIHVKSNVTLSAEGFNLEAYVTYGKDKYVLLTAHHDHWFTCLTDNIIGLLLMLIIAKNIKRTLHQTLNTLVITSFTAEESGAPGYAGWYWIYGSRKYIEYLDKRDMTNNIDLVINLDAIGGEKLEVYTSNIGIIEPFRNIFEQYVDKIIPHDMPYFDSFNFSYLRGIPTITFTSFNYINDIYHSDVDNYDNIKWNTIISSYQVLQKLLRNVLNKDLRKSIRYSKYIELLYDEVTKFEVPVELKLNIYRLYQYIKKAEELNEYEHLFKLVNRLSKVAPKPIFEGDYRHDYGKFNVKYFPKVLTGRDIELIEKAIKCLIHNNVDEAIDYLKKVPSKRVVPGTEHILFSLNIKPLISILKVHGIKYKHLILIKLKEAKEILLRVLDSACKEYIELINEFIKDLYEVIN